MGPESDTSHSGITNTGGAGLNTQGKWGLGVRVQHTYLRVPCKRSTTPHPPQNAFQPRRSRHDLPPASAHHFTIYTRHPHITPTRLACASTNSRSRTSPSPNRTPPSVKPGPFLPSPPCCSGRKTSSWNTDLRRARHAGPGTPPAGSLDPGGTSDVASRSSRQHRVAGDQHKKKQENKSTTVTTSTTTSGVEIANTGWWFLPSQHFARRKKMPRGNGSVGTRCPSRLLLCQTPAFRR